MKSLLSRMASACLVSGLAACALPNPEHVTVVGQPASTPVRTVTGFTEGLKCMDRMLADRGFRNVVVTATLLPDQSGRVAVGEVNMLIRAVSLMSAQSNAINFVDFVRQPEIGLRDLPNTLGVNVETPEFVIAGGVSQADNNISEGREGFDISTGFLNFGAGRDRRVGSISLDLWVRRMVGQVVIPGVSSNNTITITSDGDSANIGARVIKAGIQFELSSDSHETIGQAMRALIELGTIELFGKLFKVPYWQCLEIEGRNKQVQQELREWFDALKPGDALKFLRNGLEAAGYDPGRAGLVEAVQRFQADSDLVATGSLTFETFSELVIHHGSHVPAATDWKSKAVEAATSRQNLSFRERDKLAVTVRVSGPLGNRGAVASPGAGFKVGDVTRVIVTMTRGAHVRCLYQDTFKTWVRLYPNRFQPESYVPADAALMIPANRGTKQAGFELKMLSPGSEKIICAAASDGFDDGAEIFGAIDLRPIQGLSDKRAVLADLQASAKGEVAVDAVTYEVAKGSGDGS